MSTMKARRPLGSLTHSESTSKSSSSSSSLGMNRSSAMKKSTSNTNVFAAATSTASKSGALGALDPSAGGEGEMTVEQFLEQKCQAIMDDVKKNANDLVAKLQAEYVAGAEEVKNMLQASISANAAVSSGSATGGSGSTSSASTSLCLLLKCNTGPHIGQKFRLELADGKEEDTFKVGRSTGRAFKEKGLSLYKDKEVSTAHGKFEIKNNAAFYIDTKSTNGSSLNGKMIEAQQPVRLKEGDLLSLGGTELFINVRAVCEGDLLPAGESPRAEGEEDENFASV